MGKYPRQEILDAFDAYNAAREHALETGDWSRWVDCFREDAHYIEHAYGEFHGREAIREWITKAIKPGPKLQVVAENKLGEFTYASPAIAHDRFYIRGTKHLFCIGTESAAGK